VVDAGACVTLGAATGGERPAAVAVADAVVVAAGAIVAGTVLGFGAGEDDSIAAGVGPMTAVRSGRAAGLCPFACVANCRAASRVRQYPAA
jgi:hypothetical protein